MSKFVQVILEVDSATRFMAEIQVKEAIEVYNRKLASSHGHDGRQPLVVVELGASETLKGLR